MFKLNILYKHKCNTDVAFSAQSIAGEYEHGISLVGTWWNIVHAPARIKRDQVIFISNEQLDNWKEFIPGVSPRRESVKLQTPEIAAIIETSQV